MFQCLFQEPATTAGISVKSKVYPLASQYRDAERAILSPAVPDSELLKLNSQ